MASVRKHEIQMKSGVCKQHCTSAGFLVWANVPRVCATLSPLGALGDGDALCYLCSSYLQLNISKIRFILKQQHNPKELTTGTHTPTSMTTVFTTAQR